MIESTSSSDRTQRALAAQVEAPKAALRIQPGSDSLSTDKAQQLQDALDRQPAIRPEVLARGLQLAADPSYPSAAVVRSVAQTILAAPDLTEDVS